LWNAAAATGISEAEWAKGFDTVSVCFSKGLGAPVGSALAGSKDAIKEARRHRKLFGGAMRQAGVIGAGALYALQHNRKRLKDDHANAQIIAEAVQAGEGLTLLFDAVETNIVIFRVEPKLGSAAEFVAELKGQGVLCLAIGPQQVRMVTHLDVSEAQCKQAAKIIRETAGKLASGKKSAKELEPAY
jgi:threonine aldolase